MVCARLSNDEHQNPWKWLFYLRLIGVLNARVTGSTLSGSLIALPFMPLSEMTFYSYYFIRHRPAPHSRVWKALCTLGFVREEGR